MRLETKAQIAKTSLSLLLVVVFIFLLGLVVLVVCAGLQINPFRETTTSFLISAFMGLVGVAAVLVLFECRNEHKPHCRCQSCRAKAPAAPRITAEMDFAFCRRFYGCYCGRSSRYIFL